MGNTCDGGGDDLLPEELWIQILVWLPVISLLRFKSVCKTWRALIETSFFIDLHTTTTSSSSNLMDTFILQAFEYYSKSTDTLDTPKRIFMLSSGGGGGDQVMFRMDNLGFPPCSKDSMPIHSILMVGSCNGLICLHDKILNDVSLWNPATRQFRILPKPISIKKKEERIITEFVAFGFDVQTKDYKVVWISCFKPSGVSGVLRGEGCICRVQVYSLRTNSWRLLEDIISLPAIPMDKSFLNHGIYLNGSYFFVGTKCIIGSSMIPVCNNNSLMLSFEFTKEIFTTMQFPDHDTRRRHTLVLSHYLDEKIAVFTLRNSSNCYDYYDIWVLNEHGSSSIGMNEESWTKLHSLQIQNRFSSVLILPICILNKGEFALIRTKDENRKLKLELFNLFTKEVEKDFTIGDGVLTKRVEKYITTDGGGVLRADVYKQSLVSITGGNGAAAHSQCRIGPNGSF